MAISCFRFASATALAVIPLLVIAEEKVDLSVVNRIRTEAFSNSTVMDIMFYLTDVHGPRLANSPNYRAAGDWAVGRLKEYGLVNVREEKWGPFGREWQNKYYEGHMVDPQFSSLMAIPLAWTESTNGAVTGEPVLAVIRTQADMDKYKGKLRGKIVMTARPRTLPFPTTAEAHRFTDAELAAEIEAPDPGRASFFSTPTPFSRGDGAPPLSREARQALQDKIVTF